MIPQVPQDKPENWDTGAETIPQGETVDPAGETAEWTGDGGLIHPGVMVDGFRVIRLLGRGGMGEVYLARDTGLGRKVALKVLRPGAIGSQDAIDRFVQEARTTARFSHPHIIAIHAVGQFAGHPYVALEYLEGQTLGERVREGQLGLPEAMRIGLAIAEALLEAHRHKVLHRDLKPDNVMIPRDGRIRVLDYGLAKRVSSQLETRDGESVDLSPVQAGELEAFQTQASGVRGTPNYMAPEQWKNDPCSGATDVWALGLVLHELVTGKHPFLHLRDPYQLCMSICGSEPIPPISGEFPEELTDLVARCLLKEPERRPPITEIVEVLQDLLAGGRSALAGERSPFRGLLPFAERHADQFFGRGTEIATFLERMREEPLLPVVGLSGAGKSSFVSAGVIPRLREQGRWIVLAMRPGRHPFRALAGRLIAGSTATGTGLHSTPASMGASGADSASRYSSADFVELDDAANDLRRELTRSPTALALRLNTMAQEEQARVLLYVDQLEELYTLVPDEETRRLFMDAICQAADDPQGPVRTIFTLRDDYLGRLAGETASRDALSRVTVLGSPGVQALRQIMTRPVASVGYGWDDSELVGEMVAAVAGEQAALPLLQFTGRLLWESRDRKHRLLRWRDYEEMGGVAGALAFHADEMLAALTPEQMRAAREIFLRLVTPRGTRQVMPRRKLVEGLGEGAREVLDRLIQDRAIVVRKSRRVGGREPELELAHESMIEEWGQLARWIEESREELAFLAEVGQTAELWDRRGRRAEEVWQGEALHDARRALNRCTTQVPDHIVQFLQAGSRHEQRVQRRNRTLLAAGFVLSVMVALGSVWAAINLAEREHEAQQQRTEAEFRHAEAQREGARAAQLRGDLLETRARLRRSLEMQDSPLARALWWQLAQDPLRWEKLLGAVPYDVSFSSDGGTLAIACVDRTVQLFDVQTGAVRTLRGHKDQLRSVAFSPDGRYLVSGGLDGAVLRWELPAGEPRPLDEGDGALVKLAVSPDGQSVAVARSQRPVEVIDADRGETLQVLEGHTGGVQWVEFSRDGRVLATAGADGTIGLWDAASGTQLRVLRGHERNVTSVAFDPGGGRLASSGFDGSVRIWDTASGEELRTLRGHAKAVFGVQFGGDGQQLVSVSWDRTVRIWDVASGEPRTVLRGHEDGIRTMSVSPDGSTIATVAQDTSVRLWDMETTARTIRSRGHGAAVHLVAFSPDGAVVASAGKDGAVRLWDVRSGDELQVLKVNEESVNGVFFSPDGRQIAASGDDNLIRIWDVSSATPVRELVGHTLPVIQVEFSPDGRHILSCAPDGSPRLWDAASGAAIRTLEGGTELYMTCRFSPDSREVVASGYSGVVHTFDVASGRIRSELEGHTSMAWGSAYDPTGRWLATGSDDRTVRLWDRTGGGSRVLADLVGRVYWLDFHPDGSRIGVPTSDGALILDAEGDERTALIGHRAEVNSLRFSPDGSLLATSSDDGTVRLWHADSGQPYWRAPILLPSPARILTHDGWVRLDGEPSSLAPGGTPAWQAALEQRARQAHLASDGRTLCLRSHSDGLEVWDTAEDSRRVDLSVRGLDQVLALPGACAALTADGLVQLVDDSGTLRTLREGASAMALDGEQLLVASGPEIGAYGLAGEQQQAYPDGLNVMAMARLARRLLVGFEDGAIESRPMDDGDGGVLNFAEVPASPVTRIIPGPMDTAIAGYSNGTLGIWNLHNGMLLYDVQLHGPVDHLVLEGDRLHAATELGDHEVLDLSVFNEDYCDLLQTVWRAVPIAWQNARPALEQPDPDHDCQR